MTHTANTLSEQYLNASGKLLKSPGAFFEDFGDNGAGTAHAVKFLIVAGLMSTAASLLVNRPAAPVAFCLILLSNAMGMALFSALIGYIVMGMALGRKVPFPRLFSVYAFAFGITLLFSWIPFFLWFTEPWKWWLVFTGLTRSCGFRRRDALLVVGLSVIIILLFFVSLMAIM